jgi:hypothetical protein
MKFRHPFSWFLIALAVFTGPSALAQTAISLDSDTKAFQSRKLQAGAIGVSVNYEPYKLGQGSSDDPQNLTYQISYKGQVKLKEGAFTLYTGEVVLKDLDGDRSSEIVVRTFSGGAHCCTSIKIYSWRGDRFVKTETGFMDGQGGTFQDLDGDGRQEILSYDNAFLYAFSSYAGSFPPSLIYTFRNGKLEDVTRKYPKPLRSQLQAMFKTFQERRHQGEINGVLAGYVAQKALLGEFKQGWDFMMANYDRTSDWGLARLDNQGREIGRHPNFPAALKALLIERGYLDAQGRSR